MDAIGKIKLLKDAKGMMVVFVAIAIMVLIGFLGLAVDLGHMQVVRGELQNAADAIALAGAKGLYVQTPGTLPTLNWGNAQSQAIAFIGKNRSDGKDLQDAQIVYGYWDTSAHNWVRAPVPSGTPVYAGGGVPAVGATVKRDASNNRGEVTTFFMKVLGKNSAPVGSRQAVAMSGAPGAVSPGNLFPMALSSCFTTDPPNGIFLQPPSTWSGPTFPICINAPYGGAGSTCYTGQWTSFKLGTSDVPTIRNLITNGNPDSLQIGDSIFIQPGQETTLYNASRWNPPLPSGGEDVLMAIVDSMGSDLSTKGLYPIKGFAEFHIASTTGGSNPQVCGYFLAYYQDFPKGMLPVSGAPTTNVVTPPMFGQ